MGVLIFVTYGNFPVAIFLEFSLSSNHSDDTIIKMIFLFLGLITSTEKKIFDDLDIKTSHPKYWMPLVWAGTIVSSAR